MTQDTPEQLHSIFCKETGREACFPIWQRAYLDYLSKGYTCADLSLVLRYIKRENNRMNGAAFSLRQDKLFDFEYMHFDALLNEARAKDRNRRPAPSPKSQIIAAYEKPVDTEQSSLLKLNGDRHVSEIFKSIGGNQ